MPSNAAQQLGDQHPAAGYPLQQTAMSAAFVEGNASSDPLLCLESSHHLEFDVYADQGLLKAAGDKAQAVSSSPVPTPPNCSAAGGGIAARTRRYQRTASEPDTPRQSSAASEGASSRSSPSGSPTAPPAKQAKQQQCASPVQRALDTAPDACGHHALGCGAVLVLSGNTVNLTVDARGPPHSCPHLCLPVFVSLGRGCDATCPAQASPDSPTVPPSQSLAASKAQGPAVTAQAAHSPVSTLDPLCQPTTPLMHATAWPCSSGSCSGGASSEAGSSSCSSNAASPTKDPLADTSGAAQAAPGAAGSPAAGSLGAGHWAAALWERVQCLEARNRELEEVAGSYKASQQRAAQDHAAAMSALLDQVRQLQATLSQQQAAAAAQAGAAAAAQEALAAAAAQRAADQALIALLQEELAAAKEVEVQLAGAQAALVAQREAGAGMAQELHASQQQVAGLQAALHAAAAHKEGLLQQQAALVAAVAALSYRGGSGGGGGLGAIMAPVTGRGGAPGKDLAVAAAASLLEPFSKADAAAAGKDTALAAGGKDTAPLLALSVELMQLRSLYSLLQADYAELEGCLKESERLRREACARYAFTLLDEDHDGLVPPGALSGYEVFAPLPLLALASLLQRWAWSSGTPGLLNADDFVRLVEVVQDRERPEVQRFWFNALDLDGDGLLSPQDMRQLYDAVDRSAAGYVVPFADLVEQIYDMVGVERSAEARRRGFTSMQLRASKLAPGVIGLLVNYGNMLLQRTTAEWGRGNYPL